MSLHADAIRDVVCAMGAKYLPTKKDMEASRRFQNKQCLPKSTFKKAAVKPSQAALPAEKNDKARSG